MWAEAYLPQIGWIGCDPILGELTSRKYVVAGISNHRRWAMPISRMFYDAEGFNFGMKASVSKRLKLGAEPHTRERRTSNDPVKVTL